MLRRLLATALLLAAAGAFAAAPHRLALADDEPTPGMDGEPAPEGGEGGMEGGDEGMAEGDAGMAEGGAAADGSRTLRFEKLGLTWKIPAAPKPPPQKEQLNPGEVQPPTAIAVGYGTELKLDAEKAASGEIAELALVEDGRPVCIFRLLTQPEQPGGTPSGFVRNDNNFDDEAKAAFDGPATPQIDDSTPVGNWRGAMRGMTGKSKEDGKPLLRRHWFAILHGVIFHVHMIALDKAEIRHKDWYRGVVAGLAWDDPSEGVRGPMVAPFPGFTAARKDAIESGKAAKFTHSLLTLSKSEKWDRLKLNAQSAEQAPYAFAAEARAQDAYVFVGISRYPVASFQRDKKEPESLIDDFESEWKNHLDDPVTRSGKDKNKKPDTFKGGKGASYEFKGTKEGVPYLERGWVVKQGQNAVWVRVQFGGKDGEAKLKADADKLLSSVKFS